MTKCANRIEGKFKISHPLKKKKIIKYIILCEDSKFLLMSFIVLINSLKENALKP